MHRAGPTRAEVVNVATEDPVPGAFRLAGVQADVLPLDRAPWPRDEQLVILEIPMKPFQTAPPLEVSEWLNAPGGMSLSALRGQVVMLHAFQMLCPGCVSHGLPQASKVREMFAADDVAVIGLHTVFEHHEVMGANALKAFVHEYRLSFPIGIDKRGSGNIPLTMQAYALQGTPSVVLIDRLGRVRLNHFGRIEDMALGALIGQLGVEASKGEVATQAVHATAVPGTGCDDEACVVR